MNTDILFQITIIGLIVAFLNLILKKSGNDEMILLVTLTGLVIVLLMVINEIKDLFDALKSVFGI